MGHDHAEGMAHVGVHVERPVRLMRAGECPENTATWLCVLMPSLSMTKPPLI